MSGGFFDYQDYRLTDIAEKLRLEIARCRKGQEYHVYEQSFLQEMVSVYNLTKELEAKLHRIDWVVSGDDSEDDYCELLKEDLSEIEYDDPEKDVDWINRYPEDSY